MPQTRIAAAQELERLEQLALHRLSNLKEELQQLVADRRRLSPALLQGLDQAASEHKVACRRNEAFAEKEARKSPPNESRPPRRRFG